MFPSLAARGTAVPIVVNNDTGLSDWPNGSGTGVRIVAFALVYIVDWNTPSPGQVNAIMIQTYADYPGGVLGGVNSGFKGGDGQRAIERGRRAIRDRLNRAATPAAKPLS